MKKIVKYAMWVYSLMFIMIVNLWHDGTLTVNSFSVAMDREDITQLRDYLRNVLKG